MISGKLIHFLFLKNEIVTEWNAFEILVSSDQTVTFLKPSERVD